MDLWLKTGTFKRKSTTNDNPSQETAEKQPKNTKPASVEKVFQRKWLDELSWLVLCSNGAMICNKCRDTSLLSHSSKTHALFHQYLYLFLFFNLKMLSSKTCVKTNINSELMCFFYKTNICFYLLQVLEQFQQVRSLLRKNKMGSPV